MLKAAQINLGRDESGEDPEVHDEHQVGVGDPVPDEVIGLLLLEMGVDDARDPHGFVRVPLNYRWYLLGVPHREPVLLPEVRSLTAHLEVLPAAGGVLFGERSVVQLVLGVVLVDQVVDDGSGLVDSSVSMLPR